jgi:hypothetical protein
MSDPVVVKLLHALTDLQHALKALLFVHFIIFTKIQDVPKITKKIP